MDSSLRERKKEFSKANGIRSISAESMPASHMIASQRATGAKAPSCGTASQATCTSSAIPQNVASAHGVRAARHVRDWNATVMAVTMGGGIKTVRELI